MENKFTINEQKVIDLLFTYPTKTFSAREIARVEKITHPTVLEAMRKLSTLGLARRLIRKSISGFGGTIEWKANNEGEKFKFYKKIRNMELLYISNIIERIASETSPNAIILFGSFSRGEDIETSDIDVFVISKEKKIDVTPYEKKLKRKINITFQSDLNNLTKEFLNNIINGVIIYGYLEVFK